MKFDNIRVYNFENALRGMRNPKESWNLSDSYYGIAFHDGEEIERLTHGQEWKTIYVNGDVCEYASIGPKDLDLAQRLIKAGPEHRKFMRQIFVSIDVTAPIYWWKEADTYKLGTTANSTSTMHKLTSKPITLDCFEIDDYNSEIYDDNADPLIQKLDIDAHIKEDLIPFYELLRNKYLETKDTRYWKELVRWLPMGWLQTRTWTCNYENLFSMVRQRENHKLSEWHQFVDMIHSLPYADELIFLKEPSEEE
jgi:hypothetical protein